METLRYRDEDLGKIPWWGELIQCKDQDGRPATCFAVTWVDEGTPWLIYKVEEVAFNTDVSAYIRQTGP
jgi:hypothetical protein